ncbi:hypothetical protein R3P38DRAFT_3283773 [Favolaschia claudopus]|uniref:Uncharacterized protein n=1 Tax=Favolaschia claudopus TaxID=2862362 RepID=A0AAW0A6S6_9AGAR
MLRSFTISATYTELPILLLRTLSIGFCQFSILQIHTMIVWPSPQPMHDAAGLYGIGLHSLSPALKAFKKRHQPLPEPRAKRSNRYSGRSPRPFGNHPPISSGFDHWTLRFSRAGSRSPDPRCGTSPSILTCSGDATHPRRPQNQFMDSPFGDLRASPRLERTIFEEAALSCFHHITSTHHAYSVAREALNLHNKAGTSSFSHRQLSSELAACEVDGLDAKYPHMHDNTTLLQKLKLAPHLAVISVFSARMLPTSLFLETPLPSFLPALNELSKLRHLTIHWRSLCIHSGSGRIDFASADSFNAPYTSRTD